MPDILSPGGQHCQGPHKDAGSRRSPGGRLAWWAEGGRAPASVSRTSGYPNLQVRELGVPWGAALGGLGS